MKKIFTLFLVLVLSMSLLAGCGDKETETAKAQEESASMTIRLSHNQPESSSEHEGAVAFKEKIEELSGGKIKVDIFPSMQLGSMREQAEAVQMGTNEITIQPIAVMTPFVEELQIVDFPFLWPSSNAMWDVLDGEAGNKLLEKTQAKGFKGLGFWGSGFKNFTTAGKEIHNPEDFQGVKMRVMPSPLLLEQYKAWGANPVPIEYAELYNALQQKIVDGQENPISTIAMNKFYEVQDNLVLSNHGYLAYVCVANKAWFDGLSDENQKMIIEAEKYARETQRKALEEKEHAFLEEIKKSDINIYELTDEEKAAFREASKPVHEEFAQTPDKKEILELIYKEIEAIK
ncbi:TRAP transporter substrate-binding protein [Crassaminicella profunda]|uniref:TRAP transporter substrate-binding protein n=1 Tax=Crassaminicella profunda TaxID=1286698 RepID=UPI001CA63F4D|nr:TRAP transporter substrate-binding protein [Crassaminicella profunda]QZY53804.1 TRAP transporter substrate-binding protein [Crassaminicella profunda]